MLPSVFLGIDEDPPPKNCELDCKETTSIVENTLRCKLWFRYPDGGTCPIVCRYSAYLCQCMRASPCVCASLCLSVCLCMSMHGCICLCVLVTSQIANFGTQIFN